MATETVRLSLSSLTLSEPREMTKSLSTTRSSTLSVRSANNLSTESFTTLESNHIPDNDVIMELFPSEANPSNSDNGDSLQSLEFPPSLPSDNNWKLSASPICKNGPKVEIVQCLDQKPIVSDILVLPRKNSLSNNKQGFYDLDISDVPFLPDGRHRVWTGGHLMNSIDSRNRDLHVQPLIKDSSKDYTYNMSSGIHYDFYRWRQLILGAEFWALLPRVANAYIQLIFNLSVVGVACFCLWSFVASVRRDVVSKLVAKQLSHKVAECRAEYKRNRCEPEHRVPALERLCGDWALCMDAEAVGTTQSAALSAETLGQVINTFLEQLTWKSSLLLTVGVVIILICSNSLLSLTRRGFKNDSSNNKKSSDSSTSNLHTLETTCSDNHYCAGCISCCLHQSEGHYCRERHPSDKLSVRRNLSLASS